MLQVLEINPTKLHSWQSNPRINEHAVDTVAKSIETFGFNVPILCDKNMTIIAGHTRQKAAMKLGLENVPVIVLEMPDDQRQAFSIADNKTAEHAEWDIPKLEDILQKLKEEDFDLSVLGFSQSELQALLLPERDFNWNDFLDDQVDTINKECILMQFKIKLKKKSMVLEKINCYASEHNIIEKDGVLRIGKVFLNLLGIE